MASAAKVIATLPIDPFCVQVYVLNRDTASRLAISSPLEAHKSHAIIFHTCGVDVGFDNPIFAVSPGCGLTRSGAYPSAPPTGGDPAQCGTILPYSCHDIGLLCTRYRNSCPYE